ncbi:conserved Plasmodium protein, unknown function [Plasmodium yoelii]|uniref:Uncharacterized protein n=2 Tax=Plasmodium yoelii TaxID=5861 RepID=A0AAE9WSQ8_PLAYO|nr:conserved Plasmodium protein, unknown function [Plasmodium yoelii]WBY59351.1 hypothetical protein Py17XNL_001205184 [Plasmodium yoelii yoelii]CDU19491.1 conserved Plasmodium protein, unknown function [Plasmodium yoelii]VTZ80126.1 conserved Plasmodium protein, unknown function [Plasmodium yoelii]|eukprot:XP_022812680.1 conserved Plasmodium protein, unknown function [Plasmodium yoelii]
MKRYSEGNEKIFNCDKNKKSKKNSSSFDLLYDCKEGYSFCKKNNFNNLNGLLIEKNIFLFNFILSIKYNKEKKKTKNNEKDSEKNEDNKLNLYYFFQNQKIFFNYDNLENIKTEKSAIITKSFQEETEEISDLDNKKIDIFYEKKFKFLLKNNYFFYIKRYIHNILTNVDICTHDKPNETFFEFFSIFKNNKKKICFENQGQNQNELLSDVYFDVSEISNDSDYNYFYERSNQIVEFEDEHVEINNEEELYKTQIEKSKSLPNNLEIIKNDHFNKFEKKNSIFLADNEKKNKEKKFEKYICRRCLKQRKDMHNNDGDGDGETIFYTKFANVCLLQIFMSNLTKNELSFWGKIKDYIENMLGNIKSNIFYKGMSNYVEMPYIEILDKIKNGNSFNFIKKKKKIITLKKKSKIIKCLFEKTFNSIRISVKYKIISGDQKFYYFCKDAMQKYQKLMKNNIYTNNSSNYFKTHSNNNNNKIKTVNYGNGEIHNYLNPIVFKNKVEKGYDFSILVHNKHIEIYGYIYIRNYVFFLLIMTEIYMFMHFNEVSYTYSSNTEIFLDQILKNLFT